MSLLMSATETKAIDSQVEGMLDWAKSRQCEAEQLAMDASRLLACTDDRMDRLARQGFFKRCWSRFSGAAAEAERANTGDLIQMQKVSLRYINMLQEQQLMLAHSMLTLKNNLLSLAVKEEETRQLVTLLAERTLERFEKLESRVDQLEISGNLQGWLLGLEEREYDERYPTENMRLFQVINDFYSIKDDAWNYNDLMFMRKAIRTVKLDPKKKLSLNGFIDSLTDEIRNEKVGFERYQEAITRFRQPELENYSGFALEQISSPVFVSIHSLNVQYKDRLDVVETLSDQMDISTNEAMKLLMRKDIEKLHVDLNYQFPLAETAIELLGCLRLVNKLFCAEPAPQSEIQETENIEVNTKPVQTETAAEDKRVSAKMDIKKIKISEWEDVKHPEQDMLEKEGSTCSYLSDIDDLIYFNKTWFIRIGRTLFSSQNLSEWSEFDVPCEIDHGTKLFIVNSRLFICNGNSIYFSDDVKEWKDFELPDEIHGKRIDYSRDYIIIYYKGEYKFIFNYNIGYTYIKKGTIFDSRKETSFWSAIIISTKDYINYSIYDFADNFYKYNVHTVVQNGNILCTTIMHDLEYNQRIIYSDDGNIWIDGLNISSAYNGILYSFGNILLLCIVNEKLHLSGDCVKWSTNNLILDRSPDIVKYFSKFGIGFMGESYYKKLRVSSDGKKWKEISLPFEPRFYKNNLEFDGKNLLIPATCELKVKVEFGFEHTIRYGGLKRCTIEYE